MSSPSNEQVIALLFCMAPEFQTVDSDTLDCYNDILDALRCQVNTAKIQCCATQAYVYLLAHYLTLRNNPNLGVVSSMSEGNLSISFANGTNSDFLSLTPWGQSYISLIKRTIFAPTVSNVPDNFDVNSYGSCC